MQRTRPEDADVERNQPEEAEAEQARPERARPRHARPGQPEGPGEKKKSWHQLEPLRLTLKEDKEGKKEANPPAKRPIFFAFALMAAGLLVALTPVRLDQEALGSLTGAGPPAFVPALCFLIGDLCLGAGVWAAITAARGRPVERLAIAGLGIVTAGLMGRCARLVLQIVLLRRFYRPTLFFTSPTRAAAVGWGVLLTVIVVVGFTGPLVVAVMNLLPRVLADMLRPTRWLAGRRWWLLLPFAALPLTAIITQWVLTPAMAAAMGYSYPTDSGTPVTVSLRDVGPAAWNSLQILVALPLLVLMWEGVESARTCHRLVKNEEADTPLLTRATRIDYRLAAAVIVIAAATLAIRGGDILALLAGVGLLLVVSLSLSDGLGRVARLNRNFERGVKQWQLPEEWRDLGRISLLLGVIAFPVLYLLGGDIFIGLREALWLPTDLYDFFFYWRDYDILTIPVVTAAGIFGHVEWLIWVLSLVFAGFLLFGSLIQFSKKDMRKIWPVIWFLLRVGVFGWLLAPVAALADHSYATLALSAGAVIVILMTFKRDILPTAVWSAILAGGALALWSFGVWRATWVPAAAWVGFTILQRFVYNAGELNTAGKYRPNRIAYFQAIALVSIAMLVLGHGAADGYFESEDLASVSDRISLSVVAVIWLLMLIARQKAEPEAPAAPTNEGGPTAEEAGLKEAAAELQPLSWAWLLDPKRALVRFIGREDELAGLLAWCEDASGGQLRLLTGAGGTGKTRLAVELAERLAEREWETRWIPEGHGTDAIAALPALPRERTLLVVDNADACAGLGRLLAKLTDNPTATGIRVLLVARSTGEWLNQLGIGAPAVRNLVQVARTEHSLLSAVVTAELPDNKITAQAVFSIARKFGLRERTETRFKTTAARRPILDLHAAALVATLTDAGLAENGTGTVQTDIRADGAGLNQLLSHEQQCWYDRAQAHGWLTDRRKKSLQAMRQIVAAGWLLGATTAEEAGEVAARVPGALTSGASAEWLRDIFAGRHSRAARTEYAHPVRLAELHTLRELAASPELAAACLTGLTIGQAVHAVTFLARAVADYKDAGVLLNGVLGNLGDRLIEPGPSAETLTAMLSVLPSANTALAPVAAALNEQILERLPAGTGSAVRAYWLVGLSLRLSGIGQHSAAVTAAREAVASYRELAAASPRQYGSEQADALVSLSLRLSKLGQLDDALSAAGGAVALYRELAAEDPGLHAPGLAEAIANLGFRYQQLGRPADALSAAEETVVVYREIDDRSPGLYDPDFARALGNLSIRYSQTGRPADAIPPGEEAVAVYRRLLAVKRGKFQPGLAGVLDNLGLHLAKVGRVADALAASDEAATLYGQLVKLNPNQYRPDQARALSNLCNQYLRVGQPRKALTHARTAVAIYRDLAAANPGVYRAKLASGLTGLSAALKAVDLKVEAETARQEAEDLKGRTTGPADGAPLPRILPQVDGFGR
jgi:hypothetical protein